jgi:hypothetical protein
MAVMIFCSPEIDTGVVLSIIRRPPRWHVAHHTPSS